MNCVKLSFKEYIYFNVQNKLYCLFVNTILLQGSLSDNQPFPFLFLLFRIIWLQGILFGPAIPPFDQSLEYAWANDN